MYNKYIINHTIAPNYGLLMHGSWPGSPVNNGGFKSIGLNSGGGYCSRACSKRYMNDSD